MNIQFFGAAEMVTGSNYLISTDNMKILLDCGMFQGGEKEELLNLESFPYNLEEIDCLILSHAHIDHSGRIPLLYKQGFKGKVYCTKPTYDLCDIMLRDSASIQEADAEWENKRRKRSGKKPISPLYTLEDAVYSLNFFETYYYDEIIEINDFVSIRFKDAGHILGSSIVEIWVKENGKTAKIVFTGDLGVPNRPILQNPSFVESADYLIMESTYGNTIHKDISNSFEELIKYIKKITLNGGTVIIPSFAVGRTQELIYQFNKYYEYTENLEYHYRVPIYIDSPMAIEATKAFTKNSYYFNDEAKNLIKEGDNIFQFDNLRYVQTTEESMALNKVEFPRVIISSSGMATAGRVRHHLKHNLWNPKNAVVFVGYQAQNTLGRILLDGAKSVKLLGEDIAVKADIKIIDGFSGHADKNILLEFLDNFKDKPKNIFIVHGEKEQMNPLCDDIKDKYNIDCLIPKFGESYTLDVLESKYIDELTSEEMTENIDIDLNDISKDIDKINDYYKNMDKKEINKKRYREIVSILNDLKSDLMDLNLKLGK